MYFHISLVRRQNYFCCRRVQNENNHDDKDKDVEEDKIKVMPYRVDKSLESLARIFEKSNNPDGVMSVLGTNSDATQICW